MEENPAQQAGQPLALQGQVRGDFRIERCFGHPSDGDVWSQAHSGAEVARETHFLTLCLYLGSGWDLKSHGSYLLLLPRFSWPFIRNLLVLVCRAPF